MHDDTKNWQQFRLKRLQRAVEYLLLAAFHLFFLLQFRGFLEWWMAAGLGISMFCMNFQLTLLREQRRSSDGPRRSRIVADTFESVLFLLFVVALTFGDFVKDWLEMSDQEHLGYLAAILGGLFLAGLSGELYWQFRNLRSLPPSRRRSYMKNLGRTIIFPYLRR